MSLQRFISKFFGLKKVLIWVIFLWLFIPACSLLQAGLFPAGDVKRQETGQALLLQMTSLAKTQTLLANQIAILTQTTLPVQESTPEPVTTLVEPSPTLQATVVEASSADFQERDFKTAKILLFEDMSASRQIRFVKEALDRENYFYLDVGSAKGWFKTQLLSPVEWDLVIAAAEARRDFGGEFFEYLDQQVERGASVIVEYWDWDAAPNGRAQMLMDRCGVSFQSDWYEPDLRVFFWLEPENPVFFEPNQVTAGLRNAAPLWRGDLGDLFKLNTNSVANKDDTILLAGTNPQYRNDHAILVSCVNGRVILQGFSSHEYAKEDVISLWQNYIYQALKNRFVLKPPYPPQSVSSTPPASDPPQSTPASIGQQAACGASLSARVISAPIRQRDLFEHHAKGEFLLINLELVNTGPLPVQIYDQDYSIEGLVNDEAVIYQPHKAATGYLYIQNAGNLYQDLIQPGVRWRTNLSFDINPKASNLVLVLRPGAEFQHQVCEARISLDLDYTQE